MCHSVLPLGLMRQTEKVIARDHFVKIELWRGTAGAETRLHTWQGRIALASGGISGRDVKTLPGDVSPNHYVMAVNSAWDVRPGDEAWTATARYRVVAVDPLPHSKQVLMELLQ